jgi:hypothetical protein
MDDVKWALDLCVPMHSNMRQETQNVGFAKAQARLEWCVQMLQDEDRHSQRFRLVAEREHRNAGPLRTEGR